LLQLGLDFLELLRQALEDTVLLDNFEDAAFRSCLTVASCTTILARITRNPATKVIKSSLDKKQALR
jgi:hypothetical protein